MRGLILLAALTLAGPAHGADTYTANYHIIIPSTGSLNWGTKTNANFVNIDTTMASIAISTGQFKMWQSTASPALADLLTFQGSTIAAVDYGLRGSTLAAADWGLRGSTLAAVDYGLRGSTLAAVDYGLRAATIAYAANAGAILGSLVMAANANVTASTGTFAMVKATATGNGSWSIVASSGILVQGTGEVRAPYFVGDGSKLTGVTGSGDTMKAANEVISGSWSFTNAGMTLPWGQAKWVIFTGTGTVTLQAGYGISSVRDDGTGQYSLIFTSSFTYQSYSCVCTSWPGGVSAGDVGCEIGYDTLPNRGTVAIETRQASTQGRVDVEKVAVHCWGY